MNEEDKAQLNKQLDLVLENITAMEADMKKMLTNLRVATKSFRDAVAMLSDQSPNDSR